MVRLNPLTDVEFTVDDELELDLELLELDLLELDLLTASHLKQRIATSRFQLEYAPQISGAQLHQNIGLVSNAK